VLVPVAEGGAGAQGFTTIIGGSPSPLEVVVVVEEEDLDVAPDCKQPVASPTQGVHSSLPPLPESAAPWSICCYDGFRAEEIVLIRAREVGEAGNDAHRGFGDGDLQQPPCRRRGTAWASSSHGCRRSRSCR